MRPTGAGELLDRAEFAVCLDIIGAAAAVRGKGTQWRCLACSSAGPDRYNVRRFHGSLGHVPPVEYEQAHYAALNREPQPL